VVLSRAQRRGEADQRLRCFLEGRLGRLNADAVYLARACELAARAIADASPNPPVGAVIVRDGVTLGEGWHHRRGGAHAEVEALAAARAAGYDVRGATAYVSLEPCDHHGRTPPCTGALIDAGITRAVIGTSDPNPRTAGGGIARLRDAAIAVEVADTPTAAALIERFAYTIAQAALPFVTLKMAMSLDGAVAAQPGRAEWLTGDAARTFVREARAQHDAVLVGAGTIRIDDPQLTVRPHAVRHKPYRRVVACETEPIPLTARVLAAPADAPAEAYAPTIVLVPAGARARFAALEEVAEVIYAGDAASQQLDLRAALAALRARGVDTVLCEGGPTLAGRLVAARLVQRAIWLVAPRFLQSPHAVPVLAGADLSALGNGWHFDRVERLGDDLLLSGRIDTCSAV
jgi:diaminohydroxyphosphoribosylaminopyrimidine deaminase/5-amino-6-(5-phosphoribosylamino)uracil reductase